MFKTNGRVRKDFAHKIKYNTEGKEFICNTCSKIVKVKNVEFGEITTCTVCKQAMQEYTK